METKYNMKSPAVKRLMKEAMELRNPTEEYYAQPLEENLFEWHFTVRGPPETDFDSGLYHGRIVLPPEYPMKPPSIILLTPNGRFEIQKKICLSISGHHPESWQPSWSIRTALLAIIGFMPTHGNGAIGSLDYTPAERKILAKHSHSWSCSHCGPIAGLLLERSRGPETAATSKEARELATQISFKGESYRTNYASTRTPEAPTLPGDARRESAPSPPARGFRESEARPEGREEEEEAGSPAEAPAGSRRPYTAAVWALGALIAALLLRRLLFL
ncbi:ubiquitin-conjugating enzyme E2 J1-like [Centruroides sculpturatus]|uniref:ubiquitin-conjugating enzyme E2 J1-like n=1 Tax=Centruroides sculpturatus TaxID=218467 RepID=UPI000C6EA9FC|nr:ubiquitin-conjugating enzyme E2 J1-like [Centruroides sculpturatus]